MIIKMKWSGFLVSISLGILRRKWWQKLIWNDEWCSYLFRYTSKIRALIGWCCRGCEVNGGSTQRRTESRAREAGGCLKIEGMKIRIKKKKKKKNQEKLSIEAWMKVGGRRERVREVTSISTSTSTRHNKPLSISNGGTMAHFPSLGVAAGHTLQWINPTAATSAIHTFSCRLVMYPDAMCEAGLVRNPVPHAAHTSALSRDSTDHAV